MARPRPAGWIRRLPLYLELLEDRVVPSTGPRIISYTPPEVRNAVFDHINVQFSAPIDPTTFTVDDVLIKGPAGALASTGVSQLKPDTFRVAFDALTVRGNYTATIGPNIADLSGNVMDQNQNGVLEKRPTLTRRGLSTSMRMSFSRAASPSAKATPPTMARTSPSTEPQSKLMERTVSIPFTWSTGPY